MFKKTKLNRAVCIALATSAGLSSAPVMAELEEIIVTATKRTENLQNVAIAVQALGEEKLENLNPENRGKSAELAGLQRPGFPLRPG